MFNLVENIVYKLQSFVWAKSKKQEFNNENVPMTSFSYLEILVFSFLEILSEYFSQ